MSETSQNATTNNTKKVNAKRQKKAAAPNAAARKTKAEKPPKPTKEKAPREDRSGWKTFAIRVPASESAALHEASGPAGASRFARIVLNAFSNEDEAAFKNAIAEARKLRA